MFSNAFFRKKTQILPRRYFFFFNESHMCQRENSCFVAWRNSCRSLDKLHGGFNNFSKYHARPGCLNRSVSVGLPNALHDATTAGYLYPYRLHLCNGVYSYFDHISVRIATTSLFLSLFLCTSFGMITVFGMKRDFDIIYRLAKNRSFRIDCQHQTIPNAIDNSLGKLLGRENNFVHILMIVYL